MKNPSALAEPTSVAASVAPEDLRCGDFVAVLHEILEFPSYLWCDTVLSENNVLLRTGRYPAEECLPLKIKAICLPFVFVKSPHGRYQTLDIRQMTLARLDPCYARTVWTTLRKQTAKTSGGNAADDR